MTCSEDGTLRLWDTAEMKQKTVIKPMLKKPGRTTVSTCAYNQDGSSIAAGLVDGSIHIWDAKGNTAVETVRFTLLTCLLYRSLIFAEETWLPLPIRDHGKGPDGEGIGQRKITSMFWR